MSTRDEALKIMIDRAGEWVNAVEINKILTERGFNKLQGFPKLVKYGILERRINPEYGCYDYRLRVEDIHIIEKIIKPFTYEW